jgi:hypothetical protein
MTRSDAVRLIKALADAAISIYDEGVRVRGWRSNPESDRIFIEAHGAGAKHVSA